MESKKGFAFVDCKMRIKTELSHFYTDLVFYNIVLKCFVIVNVQTKKSTDQDIEKMDMRIRLFDKLKRGENDNPTLCIIFCTDKDETIVKYSVLQENKQIFASKYKTILPTEVELAEMIDREGRGLLNKDGSL